MDAKRFAKSLRAEEKRLTGLLRTLPKSEVAMSAAAGAAALILAAIAEAAEQAA